MIGALTSPSRRTLAFIGVALCITACATAPRHKPDDGGPDIKSLEKTQPVATPSASRPAPAGTSASQAAPSADNREEAVENYRKYLELAPDADKRNEAERRIADLELESAGEGGKSPAESIAIYKKLLHDHPGSAGNAHITYQLARAYEANQKLDEALTTLDQFIRDWPSAPEVPEARFRSAEVLFAEQRYAEARPRYAQLAHEGDQVPYYEPSIYKLGWCEYKLSNYQAALSNFYQVLRRYPGAYTAGSRELRLQGYTPPQQVLLNDLMRAISLSLSAFGSHEAVDAQLAELNGKPYELLVYDRLSTYYTEKERFSDAAQTLQSYASHHPTDPQSSQLMTQAIGIYQHGGFPSLVLSTKQDYVQRFEKSTDPEQQKKITEYRNELASNALDQANRTQKPEDVKAAIVAYQNLLQHQPADDVAAVASHFQYAELLYRAGRYPEAAHEYEIVSASASAGDKGQKAAYGSVLCWQHEAEKQSGDARTASRRSMIAGALELAQRYPSHPERAAVLTRAAEDLLDLKDVDQARTVAQQVTQLTPPATSAQQYSAWAIIANLEFKQGHFPEAESAYSHLLRLAPDSDPRRVDVVRGLAASVYQQGDQKRKANNLRGAVDDFLRVGRVAPGSDIQPTADYDAAAALVTLKDWPQAIGVLEAFRRNYPQHPLQADVDRMLAAAYTESGQKEKAATELSRIGSRGGEDRNVQQEAAWQSAELFSQAGQTAQAQTAYENFINRFPDSFDRGIEARQRLADINAQAGNDKRRQYWLSELITADRGAGAKRSDRSRYLAAKAAFSLAENEREAFNRLRIKAPLQQSLRTKKAQMEKALSAYGDAAGYDVAEVTTAATCRIGELYVDLSHALMDSTRPAGLSAIELEQYNVLLEEQAFPFEEKAIGIHESNIKRATTGVYDQWVQRSLDALTQLAPARYAKNEKGVELVDAIR